MSRSLTLCRRIPREASCHSHLLRAPRAARRGIPWAMEGRKVCVLGRSRNEAVTGLAAGPMKREMNWLKTSLASFKIRRGTFW